MNSFVILQNEISAFQEVIEACLEIKQPTLMVTMNIVAQSEESNKEAAVVIIGAIED
jgi:hypothetical protein